MRLNSTLLIIALILSAVIIPIVVTVDPWATIASYGATFFWWAWIFPFVFIRLADWIISRKAKSKGAPSPMLRLVGIIILASIVSILVIIALLAFIGFLLHG